MKSISEVVEVFTRETNNPAVDSVEGIMFTKDKAVIMTGTFTNTYEPGKLNRMGLWYKPWFYKVMSLYPWSIA